MMIRDKFSVNENYAIELIPKELNFFARKKWIKEKFNGLNEGKIAIFTDKSKIMMVFLEENEDYWLPFEKAKFYLDIFKEKTKNLILIEETEFGYNYYGLVDNFLVSYSNNFEEAVKNLKKYIKNENYKIFGVGNILNKNDICEKFFTYENIAKLINYYPDEQKEITDELIYINEDNDQQENNINSDNLFFYWFENVRNKELRKKHFVKIGLFIASCIFFIFGAYFQHKTNKLSKEIEITLEKINKINKNS